MFNRLVERERAIVTATPGTTRDLVTETVAIGGIPVKLVDTAGIRRALDEAESIGIQKSMEALADSDLVLVVLDATQAVSAEDEELMKQVEGRAAIVVKNKSDLGIHPLETRAHGASKFGGGPHLEEVGDRGTLLEFWNMQRGKWDCTWNRRVRLLTGVVRRQ